MSASMKSDTREQQPDVFSRRLWGAKYSRAGVWDSATLSGLLTFHTRQHLGYAINLSTWRHMAIAIGIKYGLTVTGDPHAESDEEEDDRDVFHLQAAHSRRIGEAKYARSVGAAAGVVLNRSDRFLKLSTAWHAILGLASTAFEAEAHGRAGRKRGSFVADHGLEDAQKSLTKRARIRRFRHLREMDLNKALIRVMGSNATFRLKQRPILEAICGTSTTDRASRIVAVLPTGGGKSLLFMIPAILREGGLSIVVVPLLSLRDDLVRRYVPNILRGILRSRIC